MNIYFLQAAERLTKSYSMKNGELVKTPYPMTWEFTSHVEAINDLQDLLAAMNKHAAAGHCILKGKLTRDLVKESRAGTTNSNDTTEWLVLDLDGLPENMETVSTSGQRFSVPLTIDLLLNELGLANISYIVQWSASYGIVDKKIRAHVVMLLDKPYSAPLLKQWLIQKNHEVPLLRDSLELTKTGNTLRWTLDISACQNDKLIYIAPPTLKGIKDPMGKQPRIELVRRQYDVLSLSSGINSTEKNKQLTHTRINELRSISSLPVRKFNYKVVGGTEVMLKPDEAVITDMKVERGFVYFNLNGGDSWAYYHPEDKPECIYNFKGEPTYLTKELLPSYWSEITSRGVTRTSSQGVMYLAFCDRQTGTYWRGTYDSVNDGLNIYQAKNETQVRHFCAQHGIPIGDFIPEWDLMFDPHDNVRVDVANRTVNRFNPSSYMKEAIKKTLKCPPMIFRVLHHSLGEDVEITEHFMNWLSYVLQFRDRTKTAWVLHGTQGTGKGILTNNILRPIFGSHTASRRMEELNEKYNHFMADSLLIFVDEVQIKALGNERGIMAKLKNFITEEHVPIRSMHANAIEARNYTNWIFMSNMSDPVMIDKGDRRFNVGKYQPNKLILTDAEIAQIEKELQAFHDYLMNYVVDAERVRQVLQSQDRDNMIAVSESSLDTVANALLEGNFEYLLDMLPTDDSYARNALLSSKVEEYKIVLKTLMLRTRPDGSCNIAREELRTVFDYLTDNVPKSPNKFTSLLKHHRIHTSKVWVNSKPVYGIQVTWRDAQHFAKFTKEHFTSKEKT
jgi:hypothetical protein